VRRNATLAIGIALFAVGAALVFGTEWSRSSLEVPAFGLILVVLGAIIALASLLTRASAAADRDAGQERVRHLRTPPDTRRSTDDDRWPDSASPRS
jgi:hypothetical protein